MHYPIDDLRIKEVKPLISPAILSEELPIEAEVAEFISSVRKQATDIIKGQDDRLLVVIGPCSIHDTKAAREYAEKLAIEANRLANDLLIMMRVYFEKPRTTVGWKGLINDPDLDGSFKINRGLHIARQLLLDINKLKLSAATEFLDTIIPQFVSDLISWGAIGARTTESQVHRELASGLSMPVGFKNGTSGNIQIAIDAINAAKHPHHFLGVTKQGLSAILSTSGNEACHIILRGSNEGPNYDDQHIQQTTKALHHFQIQNGIMVDCSHGNSNKNHQRQAQVAQALVEQIAAGNQTICGVMIESHLKEGQQKLTTKETLTYGQSITDACISFEQSIPVLNSLAAAVHQRRQLIRGKQNDRFTS